MDRERQRVTTAGLQLLMTAALIACIAVAATAVSIGYARAQGTSVGIEPHAGLMVALMVVAISVMGAVSAVAVRVVGRPRQR
jgi:hypothetical protein